MATTQTTKRRTAATNRSTPAKKASATRARRTAASNTARAKTNAKRRAKQPSTTPVVAQAEFVVSVARNVVQTGVTAGTRTFSTVTRKIADVL